MASIDQEFGTSKMAARPAAQTAASEIEPAYEALLEKIVTVDDPDAAIEKIARDLEGHWKAQIITMQIIDTSKYLNSIDVTRADDWGGEK